MIDPAKHDSAALLRRHGATEAEAEELLRYTHNAFDHAQAGAAFPLPDEPFVEAWADYAEAARHDGVFATLQAKLIQFQFPIEEGISQRAAYQRAVRTGQPPLNGPGLRLTNPDALQLMLYPTPAGRVPVLITTERADFVRLVQALVRRNEPHPIPPSMGACMVAGYNNWARIRALKTHWLARHPGATDADWKQAFRAIIPQKALYQDRFILLSDGPYSAVPAQALGLDAAAWRSLSVTIRLEHECTHYFTRRVLGSMQNALFDELLADFMGLVAATGRFQADWFLRFMGLERYPQYREGGRLQNYRGKPPLSDGAFRVVQALVYHAAVNLGRIDAQRTSAVHAVQEKASILLALSRLTLEQLASDEAEALVREAQAEVARATTLRLAAVL